MAQGWESRAGPLNSEARTVRADEAVCVWSRDGGWENSTARCPAGIWGQGSMRSSALARNQVSLEPGLTCFSRGDMSKKDHWTWRVLTNCEHAETPRHWTGSGHESDAEQRLRDTEKQQEKQEAPEGHGGPMLLSISARDHFSPERTVHSTYDGTLRELWQGGQGTRRYT